MLNHGRMTAELKCIVCHKPFNFDAGQYAIILRHIAYGYDFVHDGVCLAKACQWIFVEPGYDRPEFVTDDERLRILSASSAQCWSAIVPNGAQQASAGVAINKEPLQFWAVVEHRDGSLRREGVIRDPEWLNEPGGAEFPEALPGRHASLGYSLDPTCEGVVPQREPARELIGALPGGG
jgi:hypothetical protein